MDPISEIDIKANIASAVFILKYCKHPEDDPAIAMYDILLQKFDTYNKRQVYDRLYAIKDRYHPEMNERHRYDTDTSYATFISTLQGLRCMLMRSLVEL